MKRSSLFIPIRVNSSNINNYPLVSGQLFFVIDTKEIYLDCPVSGTITRIMFAANGEVANIFPKTTAIDFTENGFDLTYKIKDTSILNNFNIIRDEEGNITDIYNNTTGDNISITGLIQSEDINLESLTSEEIYVILNTVG